MDICGINHLLFWLRCILAIIPCPGYIHPDEFFQSSEIMAHNILNLKSNVTWEWTGSSPIRNVFHPFVSSGIAFCFAKVMKYILGIHYCAEMLVTLPRVVSLLFIWITERQLMKMFSLVGESNMHEFGLFLFRSSFISMVFMTRTFSNVFETMLFTVLLGNVLRYCVDMKLTMSFPLFFSTGLIIAIGFFVRPTFLIYSFYPSLHLVINLLRRNKLLTVISRIAYTFSAGLLVGGICMLILDNYFYSGESGIHFLFTPLNFILYNINVDNVRKHGFHPKYLHILVNMFALFGPLYLLVIQFLISDIHRLFNFIWKGRCRQLSELFGFFDLFGNKKGVRTFMMISIVIPVVILSIIPHQEARFLMPVLVPVLLITSPLLYTRENRRNWIIFVWLIFNVLCIIWYAFLHQGGVFRSLAFMNSDIQVRNNQQSNHLLIYWHTYMVPQHLLGISVDDMSIQLYDLGGTDYAVVENIINEVYLKGGTNMDIWLFCPSSLHTQISNDIELKRQFYPHVSMEDLPTDLITKFLLSSNRFGNFPEFTYNAFSLNMYHKLV